jgi:hypothetical protein
MKIHNLFISHSWSYSDAHDKLVSFFTREPYFQYKNYSVPKNDPIHNAPYAWQLEEAIERQIRPCSVVIIMAGKYATFSKWIDKEIQIAKRLGKPIIAIRPWDTEQVSAIVRDNADVMVGWNGSSIVSEIKKRAL